MKRVRSPGGNKLTVCATGEIKLTNLL